jgi:DNA-binding SARP family transcriptional activator
MAPTVDFLLSPVPSRPPAVPERPMSVLTPEPPEAAPKFRLNLLGGFELHHGDQVVKAAPAGQRLLAFVATRTATTRAAAAQALWPDATDTRAAANLRSTLWRLRHGQEEGPIRSTPLGLELNPDTAVDIHAVHACATGLSSAGQDGPDGDAGGDLDPAALGHDILPEWTEDWLLTTREWFRQIRLHALEALCGRHCRHGRFDAALEAGMAAVACEPLRESAHRAIVQVHLAEDNPAEALRQFELYRRLLNAELGLPPSPRFRALIAHLRGAPSRNTG